MTRHFLFLLSLLALTACPKSVVVEGDPDLGSFAEPVPIPPGTEAAETIGPEGGTLALEQLTLTIPPGALTEPTELSVRAVDVAIPPGFTSFSPVFRFEPAGLRFAVPVEVTLPYEGNPETATIFWTATGGAYGARPTTVEPPLARTTTDHFSQAFVGTACEDCCRRASGALDVLLVVDDSGSMSEEQASLAAQVPHLIEALAAGDVQLDGVQEFPAIEDLRVGVVSTDLGASACRSEAGADGILQTTSESEDPACGSSYPRWQDLSGDRDMLAESIGCVASLGTAGCGYEQPLEAALKALAPSTDPLRFVSGSTTGQGDRANDGFLRDEAVLAVVMLTDEDDCSTTDPGLFEMGNPAYDPNLNMRCFRHSDVLQPVERFAEGLFRQKADPTEVVFATISGVPTDLSGAAFDTILADPRMVETEDPEDSTQLLPSCEVPSRGRAFPPRRLTSAAAEVVRGGGKAVVTSICDESFDGAIRAILERVASGVSGSCD